MSYLSYLWLPFGCIAIVFAVLNLTWAIRGKDAKWFRFLSLAFTALTLCSFISLSTMYVNKQEWDSLTDVVPTVAPLLWICTIVSILLNGVSLFWMRKK